MAPSSPNSRWLILALPLLSALAGCCCEAFPLPGEHNCPTDARRIYHGAGEEAVRRCPCGPDQAYYGHKPTGWRTWPEGWRLGQYPCSVQPDEPSIFEPLPAAPAETSSKVANPFRNMSTAEELPPASEVMIDDGGEIDFEPAAQPASDTKPEPTEKPAPATTAPNANLDWRSAADVIMQSPTFEQPAAEASPAKPDETPPAEAAPSTAPPAKVEEEKSSSVDGPFPILIAAQNGALATGMPISSTTVPASAWGALPTEKPAKPTDDAKPVTKRTAEHLTHNLLK